jgi:diguanylate cyclase (GGDEF)-like protein/PAS domain S-box-containing protein
MAPLQTAPAARRSARKPMSLLLRAWAALIQPPSHLPEDRRRRTRLLNGLLAGMLVLIAATLFGMYALGLGAGLMVGIAKPVLVALTPVLLLTWGLNRAGWHTPAALLTVLVTGVGGWLLVWAGQSALPTHPDLLFYPLVPITLAALLLPGAFTVLTGLANLVALLALRGLLPPGYDPLGLVAWYMFVGTLIGIGSALHRQDLNRLERQTQALAEDVLARQQAEAALQESQQRLSTAFDQAAIGMAWVTLDGRFLRVNQTLCTLLGYSPTELERMTVAGLTPPEDGALGRANREQAQTGALYLAPIERRYWHKDGHLIWVLVSGNIVRDAQGAPLHFFSQIQDVTKRKAADAALRESSERYRAMLEEAEHLRQFNTTIAEVMADGLVLEDAAGNITLVNPRLLAMLGYTPAELIGRPALDLVIPSERDRVTVHSQQRPGGLTSHYETRLATHDGLELPVLIAGTPLTKDGEFTGTLATITDISERKAAEESLHQLNAKLTGWLADAEQRTRESNLLNELNALLQACRTPDEAYQLLAPLLGQLFMGDAGRLYISAQPGQAAEHVAQWGPPRPDPAQFDVSACWALRRGQAQVVDLTTADGSIPVCGHLNTPWPAVYLCLPMVAQGETLGVFFLSQPAAPGAAQQLAAAAWLEHRTQLGRTVADALALALANMRLRERLRQLSIRDALTGLFNRRYLEETLDRELRRARREQRPVAVMMLDIDHFKDFNDTLGHEAGDRVLREVGHLLLSHTRGEDIACRYGGEEFTLVLPGAGPAAGQERAELLRAGVAAVHASFHGQPLPGLTISVGLALFPAQGETTEAILRAADGALYAAKHAGRNCVRLAGSGATAG